MTRTDKQNIRVIGRTLRILQKLFSEGLMSLVLKVGIYGGFSGKTKEV